MADTIFTIAILAFICVLLLIASIIKYSEILLRKLKRIFHCWRKICRHGPTIFKRGRSFCYVSEFEDAVLGLSDSSKGGSAHANRDCVYILSHPHFDWNTVRGISEHLEDNNFKTFVLARDMLPGGFQADEIFKAMVLCGSVVILVTENLLQDQWCAFSVGLAKSLRARGKIKSVICVSMDGNHGSLHGLATDHNLNALMASYCVYKTPDVLARQLLTLLQTNTDSQRDHSQNETWTGNRQEDATDYFRQMFQGLYKALQRIRPAFHKELFQEMHTGKNSLELFENIVKTCHAKLFNELNIWWEFPTISTTYHLEKETAMPHLSPANFAQYERHWELRDLGVLIPKMQPSQNQFTYPRDNTREYRHFRVDLRQNKGSFYSPSRDMHLHVPESAKCPPLIDIRLDFRDKADTHNTVSPIIQLRPHGTRFGTHILLKIPVLPQYTNCLDSKKVVLKYSPAENSDNPDWVAVNHDQPIGHTKKCTDAPYWMIADGYIFLFVSHFSDYCMCTDNSSDLDHRYDQKLLGFTFFITKSVKQKWWFLEIDVTCSERTVQKPSHSNGEVLRRITHYCSIYKNCGDLTISVEGLELCTDAKRHLKTITVDELFCHNCCRLPTPEAHCVQIRDATQQSLGGYRILLTQQNQPLKSINLNLLDLMEEQESTLTTHAIPCTTSELNFPIGQPSPPVHLTKELEGILANLSDPAAQEIRKVVPGFPQGTPLQTMLMFLLVHGDIDKWKTFLSKVVWLTGNSLKKLKEWLSSYFILSDDNLNQIAFTLTISPDDLRLALQLPGSAMPTDTRLCAHELRMWLLREWRNRQNLSQLQEVAATLVDALQKLDKSDHVLKYCKDHTFEERVVIDRQIGEPSEHDEDGNTSVKELEDM